MKKLLQKLAVWFYEKMDCRTMDRHEFWSHHVYYAVPKDTDPMIIIGEVNRINGELDLVGTWERQHGFRDNDHEQKS